MAEPVRRVRDREAEVPPGRGQDAGLVDVRGEHPVERPPGLEGARVLEELQLERDPTLDAEDVPLELLDGCPADPGPEQVARVLDVEPGDVERLLAGGQGAHRGVMQPR